MAGIILLSSGLKVTAAEAIDFHRDIRPILTANCLSCHGGVKRKGGVSFLSLEEMLKRGKSGEITLVPGQPDQSEIFKRITHSDPDQRMPGDGKTLSEEQIKKVRQWIAEGARWPKHWAFSPPQSHSRPAIAFSDWGKNSIDQFVLARLRQEKVAPSSLADRRTLVRRLSLDLLGLLPTPREVEAFVNDRAPDAYEKLVDRLLASPHFGERWGRHWLDLARYADTDGYEVDGDRPNAWYWRDWVIDAVNKDLPFDQFTTEQLAGDLLPQPSIPQKLATAFHRQTLVNKEGGIDKEEYRIYAVMDRVSTTASVWFGLTLACAQCHDHPYEPIRQREYYQWLALFNNADETELRLPGPGQEDYQKKQGAHEEAVKALESLIQEKPENERAALTNQLAELKRKAPRDPSIVLDVLTERKEPRATHVFERGDFLHPIRGDVVSPGAFALLHPFQPAASAANRLDLAAWLVRGDNPLTARVVVNQVWLHLFGEGLVRTPDDFGLSGELPSHPELLDWLAREFIRHGWSRKKLIKQIVLSATYQQSSRHRTELADRDPENRWLHRQNRFRLEAENLRDIYLAAAGLLSPRIGGPGNYPPLPSDLKRLDFRSDMKWVTSEGEQKYRRGLYTFFKRTLPHPNLTLFDCPDASASTVQRRVSNTPLQALATLNNEVFVEAAQALAARLLKMDPSRRLETAFALSLGRGPTAMESKGFEEILRSSRAWYQNHEKEALELMGSHLTDPGEVVEGAAWMTLASTLMNLDEFITRE